MRMFLMGKSWLNTTKSNYYNIMAEMKIKDGILKKCPNVAGEVVIPEGVTEIDWSALKNVQISLLSFFLIH